MISTSRFSVWSFPVPEPDDDGQFDSEKLFDRVRSLKYDDARNASVVERKQTNTAKETTLIYGEVPFSAMKQILDTVFDEEMIVEQEQQDRRLKFVDLGSGAGRPCIAAACLRPSFSSVRGIELLQNLHELALQSKDEFDNILKDEAPNIKNNMPDVAFYQGSMFDLNCFDWMDSDIVLANSTCFSTSFFKQLNDLGKNLKSGAIFITFTTSLSDEYFKFIACERIEMSWGAADVYYHSRLLDEE